MRRAAVFSSAGTESGNKVAGVLSVGNVSPKIVEGREMRAQFLNSPNIPREIARGSRVTDTIYLIGSCALHSGRSIVVF